MSKIMLRTSSLVSAFAFVALGAAVACSSSSGGGPSGAPDGGGSDATSPDSGGSPSEAGASSDAADAGFTYVLIDDMETTMNGPVQIPGVNPPLTPGYWFNFGDNPPPAADTYMPPLMSFTFSPLPMPTTTLNGKMSAKAAHQVCSLTTQYDVCGIGVEFAQEPAPADAGTGTAEAGSGSPEEAGSGSDSGQDAQIADASLTDAGSVDATAGGAVDSGAMTSDAASEAGDAAAPQARVTVPFDISQYKGIVFWGRTSTDAGTLDVRVQFPDTDTDPRGGVCNGPPANAGGPTDLSQCYNDFGEDLTFSGEWQQFKVMFSDVAISPNFGYQTPKPFDGTNVYGINWQGQKNTTVAMGPVTVDIWVDDVYFIK